MELHMKQTNHEGSLNYKWKAMYSKPMGLQMENTFKAHGAAHGAAHFAVEGSNRVVLEPFVHKA